MQTICDTYERIGKRLFADVVEESNIGVEDRRRRRQIFKQRMDMVGIALQARPVALAFSLQIPEEKQPKSFQARPPAGRRSLQATHYIGLWPQITSKVTKIARY